MWVDPSESLAEFPSLLLDVRTILLLSAGLMLARTQLDTASDRVGFEANGGAYAPAVGGGADVALMLKPGRLVIGLRYLWCHLGRTSQGDEIAGNSAGLIGDIGYRMTF